MPQFIWDDSLNLGEEMIDRQHKTLVELINKVHEVSQAADRDVEAMQSLTAMYLYAKEHFFDEEALMERLGYPDIQRHKAQHRAFVDKTHALTDACLEGEMEMEELSKFLVLWLRQHIALEDAKIIRFIRSKEDA
ncbi:bacteriohemerythrin [Humidesulfovibrio idahonensis]